MSLYAQGVVGEVPPHQATPPLIVVREKTSDAWWSVVKWAGAALVILAGYREAQTLYRKYLHREDVDAEQASAEGE